MRRTCVLPQPPWECASGCVRVKGRGDLSQSRAGRHGRNYRAIAFWPLLSCSCPLCRAIADAEQNAITCRMRARPYIGQSVPRLEDSPLVRGRGRFAGDISFPHQLHMRVARSPIAHGRIVAIDTTAARATPGVVAVWTTADIVDVPPIDFREGRIERLEPYRQPVLPVEGVRYVGGACAAVFAPDPYIAEDAADFVAVDIEDLPVLLDADAEPAEFSPGHSTEAAIVRQGYGDIDAAMARAHVVIEMDLAVGRHSGVPIETRGAIGRYDAARDILELHGAAKVPHRVRDLLALMLRRARPGGPGGPGAGALLRVRGVRAGGVRRGLLLIHAPGAGGGGGWGVRGE